MSTATMTTITDSTSAPAKKPYARQMTDKRREQNRRSQKIYREKLRKKLEDLEGLVQEKAQQQRSSSPPEGIEQDTANSSPDRSTPGKKARNVIDLNAAFTAAGDLALPIDNTLPTFEIGIRSRGQISTPSSNTSAPDLISPDESAIPKYLATEVYAPVDPSAPDMRLIWPMPVNTYWEDYTPPTRKERRIPSNTSLATSSASRTPSLGWSPFSRTPAASISTPTSVPSPYLNHLQLLGESTLAASLSIAAALGISRPGYINDHPSPFSPLNQPLSPSQKSSYSALPKDLRPTPPQLSLMHPTYLDCIVFPRFRSNAIVLSSRGELDHCSLFLDLMHDGLVCWGNENALASVGRDMRDGVAWSRRSWEARPWFLRKWGWVSAVDVSVPGIGLSQGAGMVVDEDGCDEDGMFEGSRWWRGMRGELLQEEEEEEEEHGEMLSRNGTCNLGSRDCRDFAENGMLWPTLYQDRMKEILERMGLNARTAVELVRE